MRSKFTTYFPTIEFATLFIYKRFLLIAVLVVASGALWPAHLSKRGSDSPWVFVLTRAVYSPNPLYSSIDKYYFIPEDDKLTTGKFMEFPDPALITDFKVISFGVIGTNIDDFIYSNNSLPYISVLGFTALRSPPYFC